MYDVFATAVSTRARKAAIQSAADVLNERDMCTEAELNRDTGAHVLLAGCGTGLSLPLLADIPSIEWMEAVDTSPAMLRRARQQHRTLQMASFSGAAGFRQADCRSLPYPADAFDLVISLYVLDVLTPLHRTQALCSIARVLRPCGTLITATVAPPRRPVEHIWSAAAKVVPGLLGGAHPVDLRPMLQQTGFAVRATTRHVESGLPSQVAVSHRRAS